MSEMLNEIMESIKKWSQAEPDKLKSFMGFLNTVMTPGALDVKTKELIAIALALYTRCTYCIVFHAKKALEAGATPEEIREAAWVAVLMGGGPSLMYKQILDKALEEFTSQPH